MTKQEALNTLVEFNKWRKGADIEQPSPVIIGLAIEKAIKVLKQNIKNENK